MIGQNQRWRVIDGPELSAEDRSLLDRFDAETFIPSFPNDDERESFGDDIIPRIQDHGGEVRTFIVLLLERQDDREQVMAGEICDWYPATSDLEVIYVAVNPKARRGGYGSRILQEGTARIVRRIEEEGEVRRVFFETENPDREQPSGSHVMRLPDRLRFFGKNGGGVLLDKYYQPPLSEGKGWADNMMLCTLPVFHLNESGTEVEEPEPETFVPKSEVMEFLRAFYRGLDGADRTEEGIARLKQMEESLFKGAGEEIAALKRIESSSFRFPYATVSSHFFIEPVAETGLDVDQEDSVFNSYECDLMQYGAQEYDLRPVVTHHYKLLSNRELYLPKEYKYDSEGSRFFVRQWDDRVPHADISFNWSYHRKYRKYLATVVVTPSEGSYFTELDVLKIIALFGFGSRQENFKPLEPMRVQLEEGGAVEEMSFEELIRTVFHLKKLPVGTDTGITEIDLLDMEGEKGFDSFRAFTDDVLSTGPRESIWNKTLCGLFLGIFDYLRMNQGEIADTVEPFQIRESYFTQVCRGNLIQIRFNASDERIDKILTSAYLIIPSVVLAFNEQVLKDNFAVLSALERSEGKAEGRRWTFSDFDRYSYLSGEVKKIEISLADNYIRDLFHYVSEQQIMRFGNIQRGLTKSLKKLQEGVDLQKNRADEFRDRYTSSIDTIQNMILMMLAILQVATIKSADEVSVFAWIAMALTVVIGFYLFFRKRRM